MGDGGSGLFPPSVREVNLRFGGDFARSRSSSSNRSPTILPCFIQDYATDRHTYMADPHTHTQYSLSFKRRERREGGGNGGGGAIARAVQKVDIIAGLDLLSVYGGRREETEERRAGWRRQMGDGPKYLQCILYCRHRLRFTVSSETRVVGQMLPQPLPCSVTSIGGNLLLRHICIRRTREAKKKVSIDTISIT